MDVLVVPSPPKPKTAKSVIPPTGPVVRVRVEAIVRVGINGGVGVEVGVERAGVPWRRRVDRGVVIEVLAGSLHPLDDIQEASLGIGLHGVIRERAVIPAPVLR